MLTMTTTATTSFNMIDYIFLFIFFASILAGLVRGVIKEVVSLASWILAFFVASMFSSSLSASLLNSSFMQSIISNLSNSMNASATQPITLLSLGISFILLFVVTLIIGTIIGYILTRAIESTGLGFINRLLGAGFGFLRGYLISIILMFLVELTSFASSALWTESHFVNAFQPSVQWLSNFIQPGLNNLKAGFENQFQNIGTKYLPVGTIYPGK